MDSLLRSLERPMADTTRVRILTDLARGVIDYPDSSYSYALEALNISRRINYEFGIGRSYARMGEVYNAKGNYDLALRKLVDAYAIYEKLGMKKLMITTMNSIGNTHMGNNDIEKAVTAFKSSYNMAAEEGDEQAVAIACFGIGNIYGEKKMLDTAYKYLAIALPSFEKNNFVYGMGMTTALLGQLKNTEGKFEEALQYLDRSMKHQKEIEHLYGIAVTLQAIGKTYYDMGKYNLARENYLEAYKMHQKRGAWDNLREVCRELALTSKQLGDYEEAFLYQEKYSEYNDSVFNEKSREQLLEVETKYQTENKEKEIQLKNMELQRSEEKVRSKNIFIIVFASLSLVLLLLAYFAYRLYKQKKLAGNEILLQKNIIEEKNKSITDSIRYAQYIQESILPDTDMAYQLMHESFVLYKPKDIVSGDFYWIVPSAEYVYIAVVDCTGHGVPGAFMSMVGHNALRNAIKQLGTPSTAEVLAFLQEEVKELFRHNYHSASIRDGMDIALLRLDRKRMELQFSGANNPVCIIRNNQLIEFKGDKAGISANSEHPGHEFKQHIIPLEKADAVYLFSDGYADQFGGPKGKKFKYRQLQELLLSAWSRPMNEQKNIFERTIESWRGQLEQIDDILLLGFRI
jgi:serine phosphatase RsbU (regulator of sigma subunit)